MKALRNLLLILPVLIAPVALGQASRETPQQQLSTCGVYNTTLPNNGPALTILVEDSEHVQVIAFDGVAQTVGVAIGEFNNGSFSLTLSTGATVTGNAPTTAGGPITGQYTNGGSTLNFSAAYVQFNGSGSGIAGIYLGRVHPTNPTAMMPSFLTRLLMIIDLNNNLTLLETNFSGTHPTFAGGVGTVTAAPMAGNYTFSVFNSTSSATPTFTGTFTTMLAANLNLTGVLEGTITPAGGTTMDFDAFKTGFANRLANISTRGFVNTGQGVLIGGFIIKGGPKHVLITARGPSLTKFGVSPVLTDPQLQLFAGQTQIDQNKGWQSNANASDIQKISVAGNLDPADSALLVTLEPGAYTTIVSSASGSNTGIALVEVYEVDWQ